MLEQGELVGFAGLSGSLNILEARSQARLPRVLKQVRSISKAQHPVTGSLACSLSRIVAQPLNLSGSLLGVVEQLTPCAALSCIDRLYAKVTFARLLGTALRRMNGLVRSNLGQLDLLSFQRCFILQQVINGRLYPIFCLLLRGVLTRVLPCVVLVRSESSLAVDVLVLLQLLTNEPLLQGGSHVATLSRLRVDGLGGIAFFIVGVLVGGRAAGSLG